MTGKIFTKTEANSLYGAIIISKEIKTQQLKEYFQQTKKSLMFLIKDGNLYILGDNRKPLYSEKAELKSEEVVHLFSLSIVDELINKGGSDMTVVEKRDKVLTVTNGDFTLEQSALCPPICSPDE